MTLLKKKWPNKKPEYQRMLIKKRKMQVFSHYCGGDVRCQCPGCDVTEFGFLTVDHIENNGRTHRKEKGVGSGGNFYRWLKRNNFPPGYQILCMNCNSGRGANGGICPHLKPVPRPEDLVQRVNQFDKDGGKFKGVRFLPKRKCKKKWNARIRKDGKGQHLGYFYTFEDARTAYLAAKG